MLVVITDKAYKIIAIIPVVNCTNIIKIESVICRTILPLIGNKVFKIITEPTNYHKILMRNIFQQC